MKDNESKFQDFLESNVGKYDLILTKDLPRKFFKTNSFENIISFFELCELEVYLSHQNELAEFMKKLAQIISSRSSLSVALVKNYLSLLARVDFTKHKYKSGFNEFKNQTG